MFLLARPDQPLPKAAEIQPLYRLCGKDHSIFFMIPVTVAQHLARLGCADISLRVLLKQEPLPHEPPNCLFDLLHILIVCFVSLFN